MRTRTMPPPPAKARRPCIQTTAWRAACGARAPRSHALHETTRVVETPGKVEQTEQKRHKNYNPTTRNVNGSLMVSVKYRSFFKSTAHLY